MFKKLALKLNLKKKNDLSNGITSPIDLNYVNNEFLEGLTKRAVNLYERECDIQNFSKLVMSDPENTSHDKIVSELLQKGAVDPLEDEKLEMLADNKRFLRDLGLSD